MRLLVALPLVLFLLAVKIAPACAAGTVRLELVGDPRGAAATFQEWGAALDAAGIANVRLSSSQGNETIGIVNHGTAERPAYVVTGMVVSRDELSLPGARFRRTDLKRLKTWLDDLVAQGPVEQREARGAFGLTARQFEGVHADLSRIVNVSTAGMRRGEAVNRMAQGLKSPLRLDADALRKLNDETIAEDLSKLSTGTALAYALRPAGYCLLPQAAGGSVQYVVVAARPGIEVWPVGWAPKEVNKALPAIHEFLNVNIQNIAASQALEAIATRIKTPVLIDHNAMARHGLDPSTAMISVPPGRTTYSLALRKALAQAGLKFEVRIDEADAPFLWVTSMKPM